MIIFKTKRIEGEVETNKWLGRMSNILSFSPTSISVSSGAGIFYSILYSIDDNDVSHAKGKKDER